MRFCPQCQLQFDDNVSFCPQCGNTLYEYVNATQPVYAAPQPPQPSKARVIVGMAMSLCGLEGGAVSALISAYLSIFFFAFGIGTGNAEAVGVGSMLTLLYSFFFALFATPFSIVGLVMSNKSIAMGSQSKMCVIGKKTGIIGLLLCIIPLAFNITVLIIAAIAATA